MYSLIPTIAVLITCHNRKEKTLKCLTALFVQNSIRETFNIEVFLVDDGSTDGTSEAIKVQFPDVNIIKGNGDLYWNRGMRLAWNTAAKKNDYDFFLWLNDDTILDPNALLELFKTYTEARALEQKEVIITAACRAEEGKNVFSYGGRNEEGSIIPNSTLQSCKYINGNAVLIAKTIYKTIGNLSNDYTHGIGDFDYGLRANQNGFKSYTTKQYIATCPTNKGIPTWCNPSVSLLKRWKTFHSPRGLNIKEYIHFRKKFWKERWVVYIFKAYTKMIIPNLYNKISRIK